MIVVDTNVASELMKAAPSLMVTSWVRAQNAADIFVTSITLAEVGYGLDRLPRGHRKDVLSAAAKGVFSAFADHVLPFDVPAAERYGSLVNQRNRAGRPIDAFDALIASICHARGATLATRNVRDFQGIGIGLIDPWKAS